MANNNVAAFPFATPSDSVLAVASDNAQTALSGPINSSDTSITVSDASLFAVPCLIVIDAEIIRANTKVGNTFTSCDRAFAGTVAASHADAADVFGYILAFHHNQVAAEIKSIGKFLFNSDLSGFKTNENLLNYSEAFDQSYWIKSSGVTVLANVALMPNGAPSMTMLEGSSLGANMISATPTGLSVGQQYTFSVYAKYDTNPWIVIGQHIDGTENTQAWFNVQTGTVGTIGVAAFAAIVPVGGGWYRCMVIGNCTADPYKNFDIALAPSDGVIDYLGTATNQVTISGAQVKSGGLDGPMTYIKTSGTSFSLTGSGDLILDEGDLN